MPQGQLLFSFHSGNQELFIEDFFVKGNIIPFTYFPADQISKLLQQQDFKIIEHLDRRPYDGEVTTRTYISAQKQ